MEFEYSKKTKMYMEQLTDFMTKYIYPNEKVFHDQLNAASTRWQIPPIMEDIGRIPLDGECGLVLLLGFDEKLISLLPSFPPRTV